MDIEALKASLVEFQSQLDDFDAASSGVRSELQEQLKLVETLKDKLTHLNNLKLDVRRNLNETTRNLDAAVKVEQEEELAAKRQGQINKLSDEFDKLVAALAWREFALDHQISGAKFMATSRRAILGDKMGLGKTLTSLMTIDMLRAHTLNHLEVSVSGKTNGARILVIAPSDIVTNFQREIAHWAPHRLVANIRGINKQQRDIIINALVNVPEFILLVNYEAWRRDKQLIPMLNALQFDTIILDEAHKVKNRKTSTFKGVKELVFAKNQCPVCGGLIVTRTDAYGLDRMYCPKQCDVAPVAEMVTREYGSIATQYMYSSVSNVFPMTGTPILNRPQELFPLLHLLDPMRFSDEYQFLRMYCEQDSYTQKWKFRFGGIERLMSNLSGRIIARDRNAAGIKLPPQEVIVHELEVNESEYPEQYKVMQDLRKFASVQVGKDEAVSIMHLLALITRERQAAVWPAGIVMKSLDGLEVMTCDARESVKIDSVIRYNSNEDEWEGLLPDAVSIDGADGGPVLGVDGKWVGERVVLFSQFTEPLREIKRRCDRAKIPCVILDGSTPEHTREAIKLDFDRNTSGDRPKWAVVLANYRSGGEGLNFTECTQTIILDEEWNPGKRDQAYGRTDRVGQTEETTVHVLRVAESIDMWMHSLITEKEKIVEGFEGAVAQDTTEQLKKILMRD